MQQSQFCFAAAWLLNSYDPGEILTCNRKIEEIKHSLFEFWSFRSSALGPFSFSNNRVLMLCPAKSWDHLRELARKNNAPCFAKKSSNPALLDLFLLKIFEDNEENFFFEFWKVASNIFRKKENGKREWRQLNLLLYSSSRNSGLGLGTVISGILSMMPKSKQKTVILKCRKILNYYN